MGYADDLYHIKNVVGGLRTPVVVDPNTEQSTGGELIGVFVKKGNAFGLLLKEKGRRIAMHSYYHKKPSKYNVFETLDGLFLFNASDLVPSPKFEKLKPNTKEEFERLFTENQELDPADNLRYLQALHDYSHNFVHPSINIFRLQPEDARAKLTAKGAHRYLKATRPNTIQDKALAKSEREQLSSILQVLLTTIPDGVNPKIKIPKARIVTEDVDIENLPVADQAFLFPLVSPMILSNVPRETANEETKAPETTVTETTVFVDLLSPSVAKMIPDRQVTQATVDEERQSRLQEQYDKVSAIVHKEANPPTLATRCRNFLGIKR